MIHEETLHFHDSYTKTISLNNAFTSTDKHLLTFNVSCGVITRGSKTIHSSNKTLYLLWDDEEDPVTLTLTEGSYNVNTLASELQTQLTATEYGDEWTVSYNTSTNRFSVAPGVADTTYSIYVLDDGPEDIFGMNQTVTIDSVDRIGLQGQNTLTTSVHPDLSGDQLALICIHKENESTYSIITCAETPDRINTFALESSQKSKVICIDPLSNYRISIMKKKKNGNFRQFHVGPTNKLTILYSN